MIYTQDDLKRVFGVPVVEVLGTSKFGELAPRAVLYFPSVPGWLIVAADNPLVHISVLTRKRAGGNYWKEVARPMNILLGIQDECLFRRSGELVALLRGDLAEMGHNGWSEPTVNMFRDIIKELE